MMTPMERRRWEAKKFKKMTTAEAIEEIKIQVAIELGKRIYLEEQFFGSKYHETSFRGVTYLVD